MRPLLCLCLTFAALACAANREDRAAIETAIGALNTPSGALREKLLALCSPDSDATREVDQLVTLMRRMEQAASQPMSEVSPPRLMIQSVRFITLDVAMVDATVSRFGSLTGVQHTPVLFVMKKESEGWRIASIRVGVRPSEWAGPHAEIIRP
jgi:hypothetical protein